MKKQVLHQIAKLSNHMKKIDNSQGQLFPSRKPICDEK
jgi:hypothetical protein